MKMEVKKLNEYDMKRVISRAKKEFGSIAKGTEDNYNPQLNNLEHFIYQVYTKYPINDSELEQVIEMVIYDLKGIVDNKDYDYSAIRDKKLIKFCKELEKNFNPFINDSIKLTKQAYDDLKNLFTLPIKCLLRIYESISFWRNRYGMNGYFRTLEEYVLPVFAIGDYPYILDYKYIDEIVDNL